MIKQVPKRIVRRSNPLKQRPSKYHVLTMLVSTWHSKLDAIPFILKNQFHLISSDLKL